MNARSALSLALPTALRMASASLVPILLHLAACGGSGDAGAGGDDGTSSGGGGSSMHGSSSSASGGSTSSSGGPPPCDQLVEGKDTSIPTEGTPKPALGVPFQDEHYGLTIVRATDASQVTDHDFPEWVRHEYSRRQAFNADSSKAYMISSNGWGRLYDVAPDGALSFLRTIPAGEPTEPNWDATDPNKLYYLSGYGSELVIKQYDVLADETEVIRDLTARVKAIFPAATGMWTKQEGRPSNDGKIWCLEVGHTVQPGSNFVADGFISYDFVADEILGSMSVSENPDHISTSPLGNYCVPSWGLPNGTRAYKLDFSSYTQVHDRTEHSDMAIAKDGSEVMIYSAYDGPDSGFVQMVRLSDGAKTPLFELYGANSSSTAMHFSGAARNRPGYAIASFYGCTEGNGATSCNPATQWFYDKVVAVSLEPSPRIFSLAHVHHGDVGYFGEPVATTNPDLSRILFVSSWGSTKVSDVASYEIRLDCALP
ncbi:hypothetical protein [Polyangium aurulentum]|uniref:hypothetical protein n=1 Tax=Polyangium aurulentum TaxID=2567896 RepID=UPI00200FD464|nr:hypothetical protein [Polyangium aurulentum]UQA56933.1 hypothetical protein E8A73_037420 [Polyangium aurulentum]